MLAGKGGRLRRTSLSLSTRFMEEEIPASADAAKRLELPVRRFLVPSAEEVLPGRPSQRAACKSVPVCERYVDRLHCCCRPSPSPRWWFTCH